MPVGIAQSQDGLFDVNSIEVIVRGLTIWCYATGLACGFCSGVCHAFRHCEHPPHFTAIMSL